MPQNKTKPKTKLKAVGYARTSGGSQRDNTSIPTQKQAIEGWCIREGYQLLKHYVDESKSAAKVAGRDSFQQLMKDAALRKFNVVVFHKVDRCGRDGLDILTSAKVLPKEFGVEITDTTGAFDSRDKTNPLIRHTPAGVAEHKRLSIIKRVMRGRIASAKAGLPWAGNRPIGCDFDKASGKWFVTPRGWAIVKTLNDYIAGVPMRKAAKKHGIKNPVQVFRWVQKGRLSGPYVVHFQSPEVGIDETVEIPGMPEVVSAELLKRAKAQMKHNRAWTRPDVKKYPLSGFVYCQTCGQTLTAQTQQGIEYFRHHDVRCPSGWGGVRGRELTEAVLDYLYSLFWDEPSFNEAVESALPSTEHRIEKPDAELASIPTLEATKTVAEPCRLELTQKFSGRDWRKLSHNQIKWFLHYIFGNNPKRDGLGVFVDKKGKKVTVALRGRVPLPLGERAYPLEAFTSDEMRRVKEAAKTKRHIKTHLRS